MFRRLFSRGCSVVNRLLIPTLFWTCAAQGAVLYWDPDENTVGNAINGSGLGGSGTWNLTANNWWNLGGLDAWPNTISDQAVFTGAAGSSSTITMGTGVVANGLSFFRNYTLTGGSLILGGATPTLQVDWGDMVEINTQIQGAEGLQKTGGGTLRLGNAGNNYTGVTSVSNGILSITSAGALGSDSSVITVSGSTSRGMGGGALMLEGGYASGVTLNRGVSLQGYGPVPASGAALLSVGTNTLVGTLSNATGSLSSALNSAGGMLNLSNVTIAGTPNSTFMTFGVPNSTGVGGYTISGVLSGSGSIQKLGGGTLILSPSDASAFSGTLRITGGSVRVTSLASLGTNGGAGASSPLDLAGDNAVLELRMDNPVVNRNLYNRAGGSPIILLDHAMGSSALNGLATFGTLTFDDGEALTFNGRNGFGASVGDATVLVGDGNSTFTNNLSGQLTFTGTFWNNANATGNRTLTMSGTGNTVLNGSVIGNGGASWDHILTKSGTGSLTILGTESTLDGAVNINAGSLIITDFRSIGNNGSVINIGSTTTAGILNIGTSTAATAAGLTTSRAINLAGTTGGVTISANQAGDNPVIFSSDFTASGLGYKSLTLSGSNKADNAINGSIPDSAGNITALRKAEAGTWVLRGANTYSGPTQVSNGILKLEDTFSGGSRNLLNDAAAFAFVADVAANGSAGGTLLYKGAADSASSERLGNLTVATGAGTIQVSAGAGGTANLTFASMDSVTQTAAIQTTAGTTVTVGSTVGLVPGMRVIGGSAAATIVSITNGTQIVVSANQTFAAPTALTFERANGGGTVNFAPGAGSTVTIGSLAAAGFLNSYSYFNGADFVYAPSTTNAVLRAPVYGTDAGFVTAGSALTPSSHNQVMGNTTTGAATVLSLKIAGSQTVTQTGLLTIRTGAAGTSGGILVTGGSATISGTGVTTGGAAELIIRVDGVNDVLNLAAPVTATSTGGLTKTGAGTLVIRGVNAYTTGGSTNLLEGTIQLASGGQLSAASVNLNMRQETILDLNGVGTWLNATSATVGAFNGTGKVTNTSTTPVIFAVGGGTTGGTGTFNGVIDEVRGKISVVKMGTTNSQTWNGISNYTGSTTIGVPGTGTTGTLSVAYLGNIGEVSGIGKGDVNDNAGSLIFGGTTSGLIYTGTTSISIDRQFTLAGTLTGAGGTLGASGVNNATIIWNSTAPLTFSQGNSAAQTLTLAGTSTGDNQVNLRLINNPNSGAATSLSKTGAGLWILGNNDNSYTGTTTIVDGFLVALDGKSLPKASGVILGNTSTNGILQTDGEFTRDLVPSASAGSNTVSWNTGLTTGGGGFAASTSKLTVALGGMASPTALTWNVGGFMGTTVGSTGALVLNSTTALAEVELRNAIDLNGGNRTITVNDNTNTFTDFATISGVISNSTGTGNLTKAGSGTLQLLGANTYKGVTAVTGGTLVVTSLGNSAAAAAGTSVGINSGANTTTQAVTLGNGTTTSGILQYVGNGETSDRMIRFNTTTANPQIHADGSGPLILTNVRNDMALGAKSLYLRGSNSQLNMITSVLGDNGGALGVVVDGGATWVLSGANTMTGTITVSAGALGAGSDTAFGTGTLAPRNGSIFGYGGDRTLSNTISVATTSSAGTFSFLGDENLTLNGAWNYTNTSAGHVITNGIVEGKTLTINGAMNLNALTGNITLTINGSGDTVMNSSISTSTSFAVGITYSGNGLLKLGGVNPTAGATVMNNAGGTLQVTSNGRIGTGALTVNAGSLLLENGVNSPVGLLTMGNVSNAAATLTLGTGATVSPTGVTFAGTAALPATINGAGTLALGTSGTTVTVADNAAQASDLVWSMGRLTGSGTLIKTGAGSLDLSGVTNNNFTGAYQIEAGTIIGLAGTTNNLILNGGLYQDQGTFNRSLGAGTNQVQWLALGGGFAALGGDLLVSLSAAPNPLVWGGTASFVPDGAPLLFGSNSATGVVEFTNSINLNNGTRTISVTDNTAVTTDRAILSGVISNGSLTKTGTGVLTLTGANTFSGGLTVSAGTLQFSTVSNNGGAASNLGQGTDNITLGSATLSFIGNGVANSATTNRAITTTASSILSANGTNGATITYTGPITLGNDFTLSLTGTGEGFITGGVTQTGTAADLLVTSGTWNLSGTQSIIADDVKAIGTGTVLNLNSAGVLGFTSGNSNYIYANNGGVVALNANDVSNASLGLEGVVIGIETAGAAGVFNTKTYNITTPRLDVGGIADGLSGEVIGAGTITVTSTATDYQTGIRTFRGLISANLAGVAAMLKQGPGEVTLTGDNSGLTGTVAATRIDSGNLILDYGTSNSNKISSSAGLDMRGGTLTLNGGVLANTVQSVTALTLSSGGANEIVLNNAGAFSTTLTLGNITRANGAGTIHFRPAANGSITTTTANGATGVLGTTGTAFATLSNATGTYFAINDGSGNIVGMTYASAKNAVGSWAPGDHVTDDGTGYTGIRDLYSSINSLRFNAAGASLVSGNAAGVFAVSSGGILQTSNVAGVSTIGGGILTSGTSELVITPFGSAQQLVISSSIVTNTAVTKNGEGTLTLSGANSYTGGTLIQAGTLALMGGNAIGDSSLVTLADDQASTLRLLSNETIGRLAGGSASTGLNTLARVELGSNTLTITQTAASTYAGQFTGDGAVAIRSTGFAATFSNSSPNFTGRLEIYRGGVVLSGIGALGVTGIQVTSGMLQFANTSTTRSSARVPDTATLTLHSADGGLNGAVTPRGLYINTDQNSTTNETIGTLTFGSGANYFTGDASGGTSAVAGVVADNFVRLNSATLTARGRNLGAAANERNQLRIGTAGYQTAFLSTLIGGGGAALSTNVSIVPWAIGESLTDAIADSNMGNSLMTYVSGAGFRPLDFASEYSTYSASSVTSDNIREVLTSSLTGLTGKTINALVVHNNNDLGASAVSVTGSGVNQALTITSGAMLFTLNPDAAASSAHSITLGGFGQGVSVGMSSEYVIHVVNPVGSATTPTLTAIITSALTSVADITKAGRGTLVLSGTNTAGGGARKTTLNEGTLQISDLDNIGGDAGGLVFAGGTLQLAAGYSGDDLSRRSISFLPGGGTLDTNGNNLALAGSLGSGEGGLTKTGSGTLTLNGAASYTGPTTLLGGAMVFGANQAIGFGDLTINATTLNVASHNATVGLVTLMGADAAIFGTGKLTSTKGFAVQAGTISAVLGGDVSLLKTTTNNATLSGLSTFTGAVEVQAGTLIFDSITNVGGGASALGAPMTVANGMIAMGLTTSATVLNYNGTGHSSDRLVAMQGTTGGVTLDADGSGPLVLGGVVGTVAGAKTLTLQGGSVPSVLNGVGRIDNGVGVLAVLKAEANTWEFNSPNSYTGATSINEGILRVNASQNLSGVLNFGSATSITTAGTLDVKGGDANFGSMVVQVNSEASGSINRLMIDAGRSLTINGNVTIGSTSGNSTTLLNASGGGSWNVTNTAAAAQFRVGGSSSSVVRADLSGLAELKVSLNTTDGVFRVNSASGTNSDGRYSVLSLAVDTSITAATFAVGDGGTYNGVADQINQVKLGTGDAVFHVNNFNIGTGLRDLGSVTFQAANSGTITVRAADGVGRAVFNLGAGTQATGVGLPVGNRNTFDVRGHEADLLFGAVSIGTLATRTGALENEFWFDQGTLDMTSLTMGAKTAAGNSTSTMNLGGGSVRIGSGSGNAITLASNTSTGAVVATMNLTGSDVTVLGNIVRGNKSGSGSALATLTLTGGLLDLSGFSIGSSALPIAVQFEQGVLRNLGQLNGGNDTLIKSTPGTLVLEGVNTYSVATAVGEGTLLVNNLTGSGTGSGDLNVATGAVLGGNGRIAPAAGNIVYIGGKLSVGTPGSVVGEDLEILVQGGGSITLVEGLELDLFSNAGTGTLNGLLASDRLIVGASDWLDVMIVSSATLKVATTLNTGSWVVGDSWRLFDWSGIVGGTAPTSWTGAITLPDLDTLNTGRIWNTDNLFTSGVISITTVIPEPSRGLLIMVALAGMILRRCRGKAGV